MAAYIKLPDGHVAIYNGGRGWSELSDPDPNCKAMLEYFTEKALDLMAGEYHPNEVEAIAQRVASMIVGAKITWADPMKPGVPGRIY